MNRPVQRPDRAAPALLLAFVAAVLPVVAAVVAIGRTDSDWADVAVVLMLGMLALVMAMIRRYLREDDPSSPDDAGAP